METSVGSTPVGRVLIALGLGLALAAMWGAAAPAAEAVNGLTVFPRVGGIHATFALRFVAPFETYAGRVEAYYLFETDSAPKACEVYGETTSHFMFLQPGDRASILLPPPERDVGADRWCPGRYVGHLSYDKYRATTGVLISSRRLVSGIVLRVTRRDTPARRRRTGLTFFPNLGGLRETFIASFVARYRTLTLSQDGREGDYHFLARGPRGCRKINSYPEDQSVRGDRVLIEIDPYAIDTPSGDYRRRWCPGRYVGRTVYFRDNREGHTVFRRRIASHIVFTVQPLMLPWW